MAWIRVDDHFDEHPKLQMVGPLGWGVWLAGLAYCNRNLTDGFIPWAKARTIASFEVVEDDGRTWSLSRSCGMVGEGIDADWIIGILVDAGLWEPVENGRGRIDGFRVHDYGDYQPSAEQVTAERAANARRQEAWRLRHRNATSNDVTSVVSNAVSNAPSNGPVTSPPTPIPRVVNSEVSSSLGVGECEGKGTAADAASDAQSSEKIRSIPKAKATPIPGDFVVTERMAEFAAGLGLSPPQIAFETEKFRDHFGSKQSERKTDWVAAWRNWMRRVGEFQPAPARPRQQMNGSNPRPPIGVVSRADGPKQREIMGR